jgi:hypothetical protein
MIPFGSDAHGEPHEDSDVDIPVVTETRNEVKQTVDRREIRTQQFCTLSAESGRNPHRDLQVHAESEAISERGRGAEAGLHGDLRSIEEMGDADLRLAGGPELLRKPVRGPPTELNQQLSFPNNATQGYLRVNQTERGPAA